MKRIDKTLTDDHDYEMCGSSWAEGDIVYVDGEEIMKREPVAYCYGTPSYSESDLLVMALKRPGVEVTVDGEQYFIQSHDDEYHGESK